MLGTRPRVGSAQDPTIGAEREGEVVFARRITDYRIEAGRTRFITPISAPYPVEGGGIVFTCLIWSGFSDARWPRGPETISKQSELAVGEGITKHSYRI